MGDDFGDFSVGEASGADGVEVGIRGPPLRRDKLMGKFESSGIFGAGGGGFTGGSKFSVSQAGHFAECGVGGEAILAGVLLGDGDGDLLAEFRVEDARGQGAAKVEVGLSEQQIEVAVQDEGVGFRILLL